jgi:hypothetical protein
MTTTETTAQRIVAVDSERIRLMTEAARRVGFRFSTVFYDDPDGIYRTTAGYLVANVTTARLRPGLGVLVGEVLGREQVVSHGPVIWTADGKPCGHEYGELVGYELGAVHVERGEPESARRGCPECDRRAIEANAAKAALDAAKEDKP